MTGGFKAALLLGLCCWSLHAEALVTTELSYAQSQPVIILDSNKIRMAGLNTPSNDGALRGLIRATTPTTLQVYINSNQLQFTNGNTQFMAQVRGTIGGVPVSTAPVTVTVGPGRDAIIDLVIDINEASLRPDTDAGSYSAFPTIQLVVISP
jgi:hypothetical protein